MVIGYYKENIQLYLVLILWLILGAYANVLVYAVIALFIVIMLKKGIYQELFFCYIFILIFSDNLEERFFFAKNAKNIFAFLMGAHFFLYMKEFAPINKLHRIFLPFFLFSVITLCTSVGEPFFFTSLQKSISYFLSFLIIPCYVEKLYREKGTAFFRNLVMFCCTFLWLSFILKFTFHEIAHLEGGRYRGIMGNPNGMGMFCVLLFIVMFLINDFFPGLFSKAEKIIFYASVLLSIVMANSRNALFALLLFYIYQHVYKKGLFIGFIIFFISVILGKVISDNMLQIVMMTGLNDFFRVTTLNDASGRIIAWHFAWEQIQENFFVGKGFAYNEYYMRQYYTELAKLGHQGGIHNSFLTFWMDQGLIGLMIYVRSFILMFILGAKKTRYSFPIMFVLSFSAMFESWLVGSLSIFALLGMIIFTLVTSKTIVSIDEWQLKTNQ